ncbi:MAG TPA: HK97 gp10 family phage protein, partial [Solibacillus sp.]
KLGKEYDKFCEAMAKEIAARLLAKVIKRTPVADPDNWKTPVKGYVGGTLRRGWTAGKENTNEKGNVVGVNGKNGFAGGLEVIQRGNTYEIYVSNIVEYASYIEFGHRTSNKQGWVNGHFMMTISADELQQQAPAIIEKKLTKMLKEAFDGN